MNRGRAQEVRYLLEGHVQKVLLEPDYVKERNVKCLLPGSFNPLHDAHLEMARLAHQILSQDVWFEMSIDNLEKPPLTFNEVNRRSRQQFRPKRIALTRAATFAEKAQLFPGSTFVVGADTIQRVSDVRFYGGRVEGRKSAIATIADNGCRFLVFGRKIANNFVDLENASITSALRHICTAVPNAVFRVDISSSQIRAET